MADIFNIPIVRLNGVDFRTKPGATLKLGGMKATPSFGSGKMTGFANEPEASEFNGSFEIMSDTDLEAIRHHKGLTEYVLKDVNMVYASSNSQITETPELAPGDGVKFTIMGEAAAKSS
jgi:hypothetical protein